MRTLVFQTPRHTGLRQIIERDVALLRDTFRTMDYSILLGVIPSTSTVPVDTRTEDMQKCSVIVTSVKRGERRWQEKGTGTHYPAYISLIDFLSPYDKRKQAQNLYNAIVQTVGRGVKKLT